MTCKNCGAELKEGMTFCSKCGTNNAIPVNAVPNQAPQPQNPAPQPIPAPQSQQQPQPQYNQPGGFTNQQFTYPQQNYYQQPVMAPPKKPIEKTVMGLNFERLSVIAAIVVGVLFIVSGFIGMFSHISDYGTSVSGVFTSLLTGIADGVLWATVILLLAKIMTAVCGKSGKNKGE